MKRSTTALVTVLILTGISAHAADLRMSWWGGDDRHIKTQEALKVCGAKYGHTIAPEFTGFDGHLEKVTTQLAGGTEADILQINWPWLPLFSMKGDGFADLRQYGDIIDLTNWTEEELASGSMNGVLNGLPVSTTGRVFMFNKTSYDRAGLPLPTTWSELIAAAPVFKEKLGPDYYPFTMAYDTTGLNAILLVSLVATQATGKDMIDPETMTVAWSKDDLKQAIEFFQTLVDQGVVQGWKDAAAAGNIKLHEDPKWADGRLGGSYEWDSTYFKYADPMNDDQHLVAVPLLQIDGAVTEGVYRKPSMVFSISKRSKNPEAAAEIVNCLLNEVEGIDVLGDSRGLPASKVANARLQETGKIDPVLVQANAIILAGEGPVVSPFNEHPEVRSAFKDALELYAYGEITSDEAADDIIVNVNEVLEKY